MQHPNSPKTVSSFLSQHSFRFLAFLSKIVRYYSWNLATGLVTGWVPGFVIDLVIDSVIDSVIGSFIGLVISLFPCQDGTFFLVT